MGKMEQVVRTAPRERPDRGVNAMSDPVRYAREGNVGVVTTDNPPVNALGSAVRAGLVKAINEAIDDYRVHAIVLICEGRTFFAGADISEFGKPPVSPILREVHEVIEGSPKAVIAAMESAVIDSPRGQWKMSRAHNPIQDIYLRRVEKGDNKVIGVAWKALEDPARGCRLV